VSLRAQESANPQKMDVVFRVVDSGKGMSEDFQKNRLFTPFSQEDSFQPGLVVPLFVIPVSILTDEF
jgi:signal transduction histidine kinase